MTSRHGTFFPVMHQRLSRSEEDVLLAWRRTTPPSWADRSRDSQPSSPRPPLCPSQRAERGKKNGPRSAFEPGATTVELLHLRENEAIMESDTGPFRDEALENMRASIFFFFFLSSPFPSPSFISRIQPALARYHVTWPARPPDRAAGV